MSTNWLSLSRIKTSVMKGSSHNLTHSFAHAPCHPNPSFPLAHSAHLQLTFPCSAMQGVTTIPVSLTDAYCYFGCVFLSRFLRKKDQKNVRLQANLPSADLFRGCISFAGAQRLSLTSSRWLPQLLKTLMRCSMQTAPTVWVPNIRFLVQAPGGLDMLNSFKVMDIVHNSMFLLLFHQATSISGPPPFLMFF